MIIPVTLKNASDTYITESNPTRNNSTQKRLYVGTLGGNTRYSYIYFGLPFKRGTTLISAKLRLYNTAVWSGSVTLKLQPISQSWSRNRITWNNKPSVRATAHSLTKSGAAANTEWEFNVLTSMQEISNGSAWYGWRIDATGPESKALWATEANVNLRPTLELTWTDAPEPPEKLVPDGGAISLQYPTFQCDFTDFVGDTTMESMQVQVNDVDDFTTGIDWDSGEYFTSEPEMVTDPADPNYTGTLPAWAGMALDATIYWRVRVKDGSGVWSGWSDSAFVTRKARGVLTLDNPGAEPNNYVEEATPPISWTFTGATQKAYQINLYDAETNKLIWFSGKITSTNTTATLPSTTRLNEATTYKLLVLVWDTIGRVQVAGDTIYQRVVRNFTVNFDPTVDPVTAFSAVPQDPYPWALLEWTSAIQPDRFDIYRDGTCIRSDIADDFFVSGSLYRYYDRLPTPYDDHLYKVVAVRNGKGSAGNPSATIQVRPITTFLSDVDGTDSIFIFNPQVDVEQSADEEIVEFVGDAPPILVSQAQRGFQGTVSGILSGNVVPGLTGIAQRDRFKKLCRYPGETLRLTLVNEAFDCFIYDTSYRPIKKNEEIIYKVSFSFVQVDY